MTKTCYSCDHFDKNDPLHGYGTCELQDADFRLNHACNLTCDRCFNSRTVISENGYKSICCLSDRKALLCSSTLEYFVKRPTDPAEPGIEEGRELLKAVIMRLAKTYGLQITQPYRDGYVVFVDRSGKEIGGINFAGHNLLYCLTELCKLLSAELL